MRDGVLLAPPKNHLILPGITYDVVLELAGANKIAAAKCAKLPEHEVRTAAGNLGHVVDQGSAGGHQLDGRAVGDGKPGAVFRRMHALYQEFKQTVMRRAA